MRGLTITNQHTQHLMRNFGERGIICFGPHVGKQPSFVLLDEWIDKPSAKPRLEALHELALRYVQGHGPVTLKDFAGWTGLTMTDARAALHSAETELKTVVVSDTTYYYARNLKPASGSQAYLLPGFDEFMLGYKDRSAALASEHSSKIVPGGNGMFLPTMIQSGQVVGLWKRQLRKHSVDFTLLPFKGSADSQPYGEAMAKYRQYLNAPARR